MAGWSLFKKRESLPRATATVSADADLVRLLQKLPQQPSTAQLTSEPSVPVRQPQSRRASSIRSNRSYKSGRSSRSNRSSTRPRPQSAQCLRRQSRTDRRCYACSRTFTSSHCAHCDTTYDGTANGYYGHTPYYEAQPLDITLLFELAAGDDHMLLEPMICDTFSNIDATVRTFIGDDDGLDFEKIDMFYQIIESPTSTVPMRAVLQGAQSVLLNRQYHSLTHSEFLYLLVVLRSPVFFQCSMFTKITGPLQKLGRYSSFRSRARVVLEVSLGLCSNLSTELRAELQQYFEGMAQPRFQKTVDLLNSYIGHRLMFHFQYKSQGQGQRNGAQRQRQKNEIKVQWYTDDWRIAATASCMQILFDANKIKSKLPVSSFYNMVVDHVELAQDFDVWQSCERWRGSHTAGYSLGELWNHHEPALLNRFCFCQYPFLLTITSKTAVFRHSLERKVREHELTHRVLPGCASVASGHSGASSIFSVPQAQATNASNSAVHAAWTLASQPQLRRPFLDLCIRREHLLQDSMDLLLTHSPIDLKKKLKIVFEGEMGIDAGGLCKEWMHLLFMELTSPQLALFVQDEESGYLWFGDAQVEHYTLLGIALGIALNNNLMIDSGLSDLAYKLLLGNQFSLEDLRDVWPAITSSLTQILEYASPDFEEVFCLSFVAPDGTPLVPEGDNTPVTLETRARYVDLVVKHMTRQTEQIAAFRAGFYRACDTVALPMFMAVEVEALLRGERKPIDLATLRENTRYMHWGSKANIAREPVLIWFWEWFAKLGPAEQALLLVFVTATPRVPATGISTMQFRISCLGPDSDRLPVAHTCFNQLGLYRYRSRSKLERKLTLAITECQSFGIK